MRRHYSYFKGFDDGCSNFAPPLRSISVGCEGVAAGCNDGLQGSCCNRSIYRWIFRYNFPHHLAVLLERASRIAKCQCIVNLSFFRDTSRVRLGFSVHLDGGGADGTYAERAIILRTLIRC